MSVVTGWLVFRTDSMVRASFFLLASFLNVGVLLLLMRSEYLSLILILMMAGEMAIMAIFMLMFMMNPAGLNPMNMVHQHRAAVAGGIAAFVALAGIGLVARFPDRPARPQPVTEALGKELLGDSMLVFESAGTALLATMVAAIALASSRGRYGSAYEGSDAPPLDPDTRTADAPAEPEPDEHEGHAGMEGMAGMDHGGDGGGDGGEGMAGMDHSGMDHRGMDHGRGS
ncbi:MAG: NADH-quinone oxidoreductase subunit J [Actinobacteria bacterium]|nr:NADH-quinone oxidoreductase subunit J [Actinomycetota bacterium]